MRYTKRPTTVVYELSQNVIRPRNALDEDDDGRVGYNTLVVLGEIGAEVEQEIDDLRCAEFESTDNEWTADELGVACSLRVADQVTPVHCVHPFFTCTANHDARDYVSVELMGSK